MNCPQIHHSYFSPKGSWWDSFLMNPWDIQMCILLLVFKRGCITCTVELPFLTCPCISWELVTDQEVYIHFIFHFSLYCNIKKLNVNFWRGNSSQTQNSGGIKRLAMKVLRQVHLYTVQFFTFFPLKLPVIPGSYLQAHTSNALFLYSLCTIAFSFFLKFFSIFLFWDRISLSVASTILELTL